MKAITFTSEFFNNDCAPSVLKALMGNALQRNGVWDRFIGFERFDGFNPFVLSGGTRASDITFKIEERFKIDWDCCQRYLEMVKSSWTNGQKIELNLDYLNSLEGCEVKEVSK